MRVSFVLPGYAPNPIGGYKVVYEYANALADAGHVVTIQQAWWFPFAGAPRLGLARSLKNLRHAGAVMRNRRPPWFPLRRDVRVRNRFALMPSQLGRSDVIVATAARSAPTVARRIERGDGAGVYFIQHFEEWAGGERFVRDTWQLPLTKVVIAPWLQAIGAELDVQTTLVPNGVDPTRFPRGPEVSFRPKAVAAMISPMAFKRADLLIELFRRLETRVPGVVGLAFGVGERPRDLPPYVRYTQRPSQASLSQIYQDARVYVCASDAEGWHLPAAEAMLSGAAVVSTDNGGVRGYADGVAMFSPIGDIDALVQNVTTLLTDDEHCTRVAEAGYRRMAEFTPEVAAHRFVRAVEQAGAASKGGRNSSRSG